MVTLIGAMMEREKERGREGERVKDGEKDIHGELSFPNNRFLLVLISSNLA